MVYFAVVFRDNNTFCFPGEIPALTTSMEVCYRVLLAFGLELFLH